MITVSGPLLGFMDFDWHLVPRHNQHYHTWAARNNLIWNVKRQDRTRQLVPVSRNVLLQWWNIFEESPSHDQNRSFMVWIFVVAYERKIIFRHGWIELVILLFHTQKRYLASLAMHQPYKANNDGAEVFLKIPTRKGWNSAQNQI